MINWKKNTPENSHLKVHSCGIEYIIWVTSAQ